MRSPSYFFAGAGLLLLAAAGCYESAISRSSGSQLAAQEAPPRVRVTRADLYNWPRTIRTQGSLVADEQVVVGTKVAGRIHDVSVDLGDGVQQGERLAAMDAREFELLVQQADARLAQACATLGLEPGAPLEQLVPEQTPGVMMEKALWDEARENLGRAEKLVASNGISAAELERHVAAERVARARYALALNTVSENLALTRMRTAELAAARQNLADAVITAPFDGAIQERHVAVGAYLQMGDPVVTLVRSHPLRFRSGIPERKALGVHVGQEVRIFLEGESQPVVTQVTRVSPALDLSSRSRIIEAEVSNPDSRWPVGVFAEAEIVIDPQCAVLAVPASAVVEFAGVHKVWVVRDGQASEQRVQIGRQTPDRVEIVRGLERGDVVIADHRDGRAGGVQIDN